MKKLLVFLTMLSLPFLSCKKESSLNEDTKHTDNAPPEALFSTGQKAAVDAVTSANINSNIFRLITQQWTEVT